MVTRKGPYRVSPTLPRPRTLGQRVAQIRKAWGWTQEDLADHLRVRKATVSAWERQIAQPNGISLIALAAVLNTTPEALLGEAPFTVPPTLTGVADPTFSAYRLPQPMDPTQVLIVEAGSVQESLAPSKLGARASAALKAGRQVWLVVE